MDVKSLILVVDDDKSILDLINQQFESKGYLVKCANCCDEALELMCNEHFDLVLTDYMMPNKTGIDLLVEINKLYPDTIVIIITGVSNAHFYKDVIESGSVFSVIEKPFTTDKLCDVVKLALEKSKTQRIQKEKVKKLKNQYSNIFYNTTDLIQCLDYDGEFIYVNPSWIKALGYDEDDIKNLKICDILHPDHLTFFDTMLDKLSSSELVSIFDTVFIGKNKKEIYVEGSVNCQFKERNIKTLTFIMRDVTERLHMMRQLRRTNELISSIVYNIPDELILVNSKKNIIWTNTEKYEINIPFFLQVEGIESLQHDYNGDVLDFVFNTGNVFEFEIQLESSYLNYKISPCQTNGKIQTVIVIRRDVTDRKNQSDYQVYDDVRQLVDTIVVSNKTLIDNLLGEVNEPVKSI